MRRKSNRGRNRRRSRPLFSLFSGIVVSTVLLGVIVWSIRQIQDHKKGDHIEGPATASQIPAQDAPVVVRAKGVREMFDETKSGEVRLAPAHPFMYTDPKTKKGTRVFGVVLVDTANQVYFFSFYMPKSQSTLAICLDLANRIKVPYDTLEKTLKDADSGDFFERPVPETFMSIRNPSFSHKVLIYHEETIPLFQRAEIDRQYRTKDMEADFRGPDYALAQFPGFVPSS